MPIEHQETFSSDLFGTTEKTRFAHSAAVFIACFHWNDKSVNLITYLWRQLHEREWTAWHYYQLSNSVNIDTRRLLLLFILGFQTRNPRCLISRARQATLNEKTSQLRHLELIIFSELKGRRQWHDGLLRLSWELIMVTGTCQALRLIIVIAVARLNTVWYGYARVKEWQVKGYGDLINLGIDNYSISHRRSGIDWMWLEKLMKCEERNKEELEQKWSYFHTVKFPHNIWPMTFQTQNIL